MDYNLPEAGCPRNPERVSGVPRPGPGRVVASHKRIDGRPDEFEEALKAGEPVVVGAADLMSALLPHRQFAYGCTQGGKHFLLDERDRLTGYKGD